MKDSVTLSQATVFVVEQWVPFIPHVGLEFITTPRSVPFLLSASIFHEIIKAPYFFVPTELLTLYALPFRARYEPGALLSEHRHP